MKLLSSFLALVLLLAIGAASASAAITWLPVEDAGNAAQSPANRSHTEAGNSNFGDGFGSVSYKYMIARDMVTNSQYAEFLIATAASDPHGLYNPNMGVSAQGGIERSGLAGSYTYSTISGRENWPVVYVNWFDAARFSNWMTNGMGAGDTETGAYTLGGATSGIFLANPDVAGMVRLPTEDEWYKAAYYDPTYNPNGNGPGGYYLFATQSDMITTAEAN